MEDQGIFSVLCDAAIWIQDMAPLSKLTEGTTERVTLGWHMPVIPATREVEGEGMQVESSLGKKLARSHFNQQAGCAGVSLTSQHR